MRRAWTLALISLLLLAGCATTRPKHSILEDHEWREVSTPNFTIWTTLSEPVAVRMATKLELFRRVAAFVVGRTLPESRIPTHVYAFSSRSDFLWFAADADTVAFFRPGLRGSVMVTSDASASALHHEYTHYLTQYHKELIYPKWYDEGFAEFLGSTDLRGASAAIGDVVDRGPPVLPSRRYRKLKWTPLVEILAHGSDGSEMPPQFYNVSWALVHYLYFGRSGAGNTRAQIGRYVQLVQSGVAISDAVQQSFDISVEALDRELFEYVKAGRYPQYTKKQADFGELPTPTVKLLAKERVAVALGDLSMDSGRANEAKRYYTEALEGAPESIRAITGLARVAESMEEFEEADAYWTSALAANENDPITQLEFANSLSDRAEAEEGDAERRDRLALEARRHYLKSWKLDENNAETYLRYGRTYLIDGQDSEGGRETLNHALELEPSSLQVLTSLARLHLKTDDLTTARKLALRVYGSAHGGSNKTVTAILRKTGGVPGDESGD